MGSIAINKPGTTMLLMGNEAIARGAIEAGIGVAAAYPGSPTSEVLPAIAGVSKELNIHAEWSVNEKVATEVAAAASFAGIRSLSVMKQNGVNVAADFIVNLNMTGLGEAGMVIFVSDDPGAMTSGNEEDSRTIAKWFDNPLLEPSNPQEAKEMVKWAYDVSEEVNLLVFVRGVTQLSYTKGNVVLGELPPKRSKKGFFPELWDSYNPRKSKFTSGPFPIYHEPLHKKLEKAREIFEGSTFNQYTGPEKPEVIIITSGACVSYSTEAVEELKIAGKVGILKLGTTWPLPEKLVAKYLGMTRKVLFVEEMDPFIERNVMVLAASLLPATSNLTFYGKRSGHLTPYNEQSTKSVIDALKDILEVSYQGRDAGYNERAKRALEIVPNRPVNLCAGCPHRATYWAVKNALMLDGRQGFLCGDVGCYGLGIVDPGFFQARTHHSMGSGTGLASGFGNLKPFDFSQPVLSISGDSTFFHAVLPALVNGVYNDSKFTLIVVDNSATAMTGFQPHPGTGELATGDPAKMVSIESVCRAIGADVQVVDPFDLQNAIHTLLTAMKKESGVQVIIMRHMCQLVKARRNIPGKYSMHVIQEKCLGEGCGCDRLCSRVFNCPGLVWNKQVGKAEIDEAMCVGCGFCADICPAGAFTREEAV